MTISERVSDESRGYRIHGRVQGVGFRWWTRRIADRLGLRGYVRNLPSGSVEVHVAGVVGALDELADALAEGPPTARVREVESIQPDAEMPERGFHIELR